MISMISGGGDWSFIDNYIQLMIVGGYGARLSVYKFSEIELKRRQGKIGSAATSRS